MSRTRLALCRCVTRLSVGISDVVPGPEREVTAVRSALYRGDRAAALALVDAGAELNVFDLAALGGRDAVACATENDHREIASRIRVARDSSRS
jgi:hypothetical protein